MTDRYLQNISNYIVRKLKQVKSNDTDCKRTNVIPEPDVGQSFPKTTENLCSCRFWSVSKCLHQCMGIGDTLKSDER